MPLVMGPSANPACCCDKAVSVLAFLPLSRFRVPVAFDPRLTGSLIHCLVALLDWALVRVMFPLVVSQIALTISTEYHFLWPDLQMERLLGRWRTFVHSHTVIKQEWGVWAFVFLGRWGSECFRIAVGELWQQGGGVREGLRKMLMG